MLWIINIKGIKTIIDIFLYKVFNLVLCFNNINRMIIKSKTVQTTIILLKWYEYAILLDSIMNTIGAKIDEINKT